ncbi:T9SS sorting signal type C domain-containing protein [Flavobacterium celericrescens]|uniref:T9SS type A sorting domain-containing protein n=1 Tax=Flavobacterium celericrescens TaxID=2709780 RepID=A0ABX0II57_9FLAO|nr:T9SS sorting signal type C domain-containing protein [Flavobacterium celericrescens]NHM04966.1 T9SS type A sorting domain-containing protein [Flavobacterium celericrescens]
MKKKLLRVSLFLLATMATGYFLATKFEEKEIIKKNTISFDTQEKQTENPELKSKSKSLVVHSNKKEHNVVSVEKNIVNQTSQRYSEKELDSIEKLREKYHQLVNYHPYRKKMRLPKAERKALGLPPNAYNEQEWLYTADPNLGRPTPEVTLNLQKELNQQLESGRVPGDGMDNQWVERGPNNVGGRTRVVMFAPGSTTKVFAGAVSGGLWVNNDITSAAGSWSQVSGVPSNMAVTCMTVDPQNSNIMYIGTGEVYTWGAVNGNGVYKSIDGGVTWKLIFTGSSTVVGDMIAYIQDIIAWRNPSTGLTEVYFGADAMAYTEEITSASGGAGYSYLGSNTVGLYKSTDGVNFVRQTNASLYSTAGTKFVAPNSFTIDFAGNLFMGSKYSYATGEGGGRVYKCTTGSDWTLVRNFSTTATDGGRVQLVASKTAANRMFALCENNGTGLPFIRRSTDGFATVNTTIALPISTGNQPPAATDFTRGQAFYDLMIGMNPTNDNEVYVGGIEIFRTTTAFTATAASMWTQLTDWTGNNGSLDGVHSDHHVMTFCSTQTSRVVFGCDGGVYYSNDSGTTIGVRNNNYNVTQVYKADINTASTSVNRFIGGLQDNGSQYVSNAAAGTNATTDLFGGDGCWEFIEDTDAYVIASYVYNYYSRYNINGGWSYDIAANQNDGDFVNECGLDSANDRLYANGTTATPTYQIYKYDLGASNATRRILTNALLNDIPTFFKPMPTTTTSVLVGLANGRLLRLNNAALATTTATINAITWSNIADPSWTGAISDIRFGNTENDIFVTFHNYGVPSIWYTSNGGTSWQNKEGNLPNLPVKCILQNPNATDEVIIGTELGVWYTMNFSAASPNWRRSNDGMKDVKVLNFEYRALDNTIVAGTYGRGIWTGQFWQCGTTTTTWNGTAWSNGVPTSKVAVTFAGNYSSTASLDACSVTVNTGANVVFNSGHTLRVGENVTVNGTGTLTFNNGAALIQHTKHAVNSGNIVVSRNSAPMIRQDYTAWSSPVAGQNLLAFSPNTIATRFYEYLYTGTTTPTAYQSVTPSTNSFATAKGYMIRVDNTWSSVTPAVFNGQFTGVPNNGSLTYSVGQGYNLLGNPYASPISAYRFLIQNPKVETLYYWTHTVPASGGTYPQNNYASYTTLGGTASAAGGAIPNDKIQIGQGFFIQANTAHTVTFENELREDASTTTQFFRNNETEVENSEKHRIWLNLNDSSEKYNQILVGYLPNGTNGFDRLIDGKTLDISKTILYSLIDGNQEYVIQGKGNFSADDTIKLGLKVVIPSSFEISIEQFDGLFANQAIYLRDNYTNAIHDLKEGAYYFLSQAGTFNDRFELVYKKPSNQEEIIVENTVLVYANSGVINLNSSIEKISSIAIYDILGKEIFSKSEINNNEFKVQNLAIQNQSLIVKLTLTNGKQVTKKIIF